MTRTPSHLRLKEFSRDELEEFVAENLRSLTEEEALSILENPYCGPRVCGALAGNQRLAGFYSVRARLVAHRQTPQAHAVKLVHYLHWPDLLRLSTDVRVAPAVRRALDTQLLNRVGKLSLGEKISSARQCSDALIRVFLFDPEAKVFESLLTNSRLKEDHLLELANSPDATPEKLQLLASDPKWSYRRAIRFALVTNVRTPRSAAALQLRHLSRAELRRVHSRPETSVYLRKCIERLERGE